MINNELMLVYFGMAVLRAEDAVWGKQEDKGWELDRNVAVAAVPGKPAGGLKAIASARFVGIRSPMRRGCPVEKSRVRSAAAP